MKFLWKNNIVIFLFRTILAPKNKDKNNSKPEKKSAELKEGWADHLPLKYDDKNYGDRFGIQFFVENFNSDMLENSTDLIDGTIQIFDVFRLMALNSLKTENGINDLRAKAASGKSKMRSLMQPWTLHLWGTQWFLISIR
jgi:hypothetical protein